MSWAGRLFGILIPKSDIEKYLDECAEYANTHEGINKNNNFWKLVKDTNDSINKYIIERNKKELNGGYQPKDKLDTSNPPINELPNFKHIPPAPELKPFENFKNNRKKMKKEVRHEKTCIITSEENNGVITITIDPKKCNKVSGVGIEVRTIEVPKEPVMPKELLNPKPELQAQYDTLAKLIATRDYYNAGYVLHKYDMVAVIINRIDVDGITPDTIAIGGMKRFDSTKSKLYFIDIKTAMIFLENFRAEIESVKHLI